MSTKAFDLAMEKFLDRAAIYVSEGMDLQKAMEAVLEDDKRIINEVFHMARENRRELANMLAERIYAAAITD